MRVFLTLAVLFAPAGAAQDFAYVSDEGHSYLLSCNADGAVLRSEYPVSRITGSGAATEVVKGQEQLFLGRSCDAYHRLFGDGAWGWANGGFWVSFEGRRIAFPRQEVVCPAELVARCAE